MRKKNKTTIKEKTVTSYVLSAGNEVLFVDKSLSKVQEQVPNVEWKKVDKETWRPTSTNHYRIVKFTV